MKRVFLFCLVTFACSQDTAPDAALQIRVPQDRRLLQSVASYALRAERDGRVLAQQTTPANGSTLSLGGVPFGQRTIFQLDGITSAGDLVARGSSCPIDFEPHGDPVVIYFSPVNFFAPTPSPPNDTRMFPIALPLATGNIVIAGGQGMGGAVGSAETFSPRTGTFAVSGFALSTPRIRAEIVPLPGIGGFVVGGEDTAGAPLGDGDLYDVSSQAFVPIHHPSFLVPRTRHRAILTTDGHVLIIGGRTTAGVPLADSVDVSFVGTAPQYLQGPPLPSPREGHAAAVVVGVPVVFGGSNAGGPLTEIDVLKGGQFVPQGALRKPREGVTATALNDGSVLLVGGFNDSRGDCGAEIFNPVTQESTCVATTNARVEHTATLLPDGRVLVTGGTDLVTGNKLASVELFVPGIGFVAERPLGTARHGHVAVPLCDGTVLVTGGGPGAEIYNPPAR